MAKVQQYDINALFREAFGMGRGKPYDASQIEEKTFTEAGTFPDAVADSSTEGENSVTMRNTIGSNLPTGQPIFMPMRLGNLILPNEPSVTISSRKNIVETALTGSTRRGTVKELISIEDWSVVIRGVAINYNSKEFYPEDIVKSLKDLYEINESLEVQCALTRLLGIYRLVIREFTLPEMIGIQHCQAYQFICTSDEDFILEI
jgi:hypothetical protein